MKKEENSEFAFVFVRVREGVADLGEKRDGLNQKLKDFRKRSKDCKII